MLWFDVEVVEGDNVEFVYTPKGGEDAPCPQLRASIPDDELGKLLKRICDDEMVGLSKLRTLAPKDLLGLCLSYVDVVHADVAGRQHQVDSGGLGVRPVDAGATRSQKPLPELATPRKRRVGKPHTKSW